jgi:hypothetical protein
MAANRGTSPKRNRNREICVRSFIDFQQQTCRNMQFTTLPWLAVSRPPSGRLNKARSHHQGRPDVFVIARKAAAE